MAAPNSITDQQRVQHVTVVRSFFELMHRKQLDAWAELWAERGRIMDGKTRRLSEVLTRYRQTSRLERLDKQFWEDPDQLGDRLRAYAEQQGLIDSFLKDPKAS